MRQIYKDNLYTVEDELNKRNINFWLWYKVQP